MEPLLWQIKQIVKSISGREAPNRIIPFQIKEDDIFLVSYPKSGTTWLKFLLTAYVTGQPFDLSNDMRKVIPDMHGQQQWIDAKATSRIIKSHYPFQKSFPKIIYIARDGRDVAVSYFFYQKKFNKIHTDCSFSEFLAEFNAGNLPYGRWSDHVAKWIYKSNKKNFHLIKYENLLHDTYSELSKTLSFMTGLPESRLNQERIHLAVNSTEFSKMKSSEKKNTDTATDLKNSKQDISFFRSGKAGDFENYFSSSELRRFNQIHKHALKLLNYL